MKNIEIAGGGFHDGQWLTVPADMEAVVLFSRDKDGALNATLAVSRQGGADWSELTEAMIHLATEMLGGV